MHTPQFIYFHEIKKENTMLRIVDLSQDIYDGAPTYENDPQTKINAHLKISDFNYNITEIIMSAHYGTHMDAPYHFFDDGRTVENLDIRRGIGHAHVLDFTHIKAKEIIGLEDMAPYQDKVYKGSRLIFHMGWDKAAEDPGFLMDQPYLSVELTTWLAHQGVVCVALDAQSINISEYTPAHHSLLNKNAEVLIIEGLCGLDQLQNNEVILIAIPLRIRGRDGSPCRAIAIEGNIEPLIPLFEQLSYDVP
jgi:kynurenine formamidase